jgi:hypothetical protein
VLADDVRVAGAAGLIGVLGDEGEGGEPVGGVDECARADEDGVAGAVRHCPDDGAASQVEARAVGAKTGDGDRTGCGPLERALLL